MWRYNHFPFSRDNKTYTGIESERVNITGRSFATLGNLKNPEFSLSRGAADSRTSWALFLFSS